MHLGTTKGSETKIAASIMAGMAKMTVKPMSARESPNQPSSP